MSIFGKKKEKPLETDVVAPKDIDSYAPPKSFFIEKVNENHDYLNGVMWLVNHGFRIAYMSGAHGWNENGEMRCFGEIGIKLPWNCKTSMYAVQVDSRNENKKNSDVYRDDGCRHWEDYADIKVSWSARAFFNSLVKNCMADGDMKGTPICSDEIAEICKLRGYSSDDWKIDSGWYPTPKEALDYICMKMDELISKIEEFQLCQRESNKALEAVKKANEFVQSLSYKEENKK